MIFASLLIAAIRLAGVVGGEITARTYFDVNNAKVGDPLILTVDFFGDADFTRLHPPALSRYVDRADWKVDDASAKTETDTRQIGGFFSSREVTVGRTLTYRVRPMREGVLYFPALKFEYAAADGTVQTVVANEIPVHARKGEQVSVPELGEDLSRMPEPPALVTEVDDALFSGDDERWNWKRACAAPSADAFKEFHFPAGRMNEARMAILAGQWQRAVSIYSRLEWRIGQTPEIEQGLVAALARKYDNPAAELPVWRTVGRPVLRYSWQGRLAVLAGALLAVTLLWLMLSRLIRALAVLTALLMFVPAASAQGFFGGMFDRHDVEISVSVRTEPAQLQVGTPFDLILSVETPKNCSVTQMQISPSEAFGLVQTGKAENLTDAESHNPSNTVKRLSIPVRYDVPFRGKVSFTVSGMVSGRHRRGSSGNMFMMNFSQSFSARSPAVDIDVKPLPGDGQPGNFSGIVSSSVALTERLDMKCVGTNDVIQIVYRLQYRGYLPEKWRPQGVAFEIGRGSAQGVNVVEWQRYFVADGAKRTPRITFSYYDPEKREYRNLEAGGTDVEYRP